MNLSGKTVLLTGATAGIGHETLKALIAKGCEVIVLGRESERLMALERGRSEFCVNMMLHSQ